MTAASHLARQGKAERATRSSQNALQDPPHDDDSEDDASTWSISDGVIDEGVLTNIDPSHMIAPARDKTTFGSDPHQPMRPLVLNSVEPDLKHLLVSVKFTVSSLQSTYQKSYSTGSSDRA